MMAYDQISWIFSIGVILHVSHVILHLSDGMNYLVADSVNSLREGYVWRCLQVLNTSSWGIPCTCVFTLSTDASSDPQATDGTAECYHAKVDSNQLATGRTITTSSTASRVLLLGLLGNTTSRVCQGDGSAWSEPLALSDWVKVWTASLHWASEGIVCSTTTLWLRKCVVGLLHRRTT
jgi:hypothetical protein